MQLLIYCAGGFGMEVMDIARRLNRKHGRWRGIAFADDGQKGATQYGADVFQFDEAVSRFGKDAMEAVIATGEPFIRKALREKIENAGVRLATIIDETTVISETAIIGAGTVLFPGCFVSSMANIGSNVAIIAGSLVGHHSKIGDNTFIAGHVNIGGECAIGCECYLGMGVQLKQQTSVGWASIVGMGSIVFKDIPAEMIALGNPCRPMRPNTDKKVSG